MINGYSPVINESITVAERQLAADTQREGMSAGSGSLLSSHPWKWE